VFRLLWHGFRARLGDDFFLAPSAISNHFVSAKPLGDEGCNVVSGVHDKPAMGITLSQRER